MKKTTATIDSFCGVWECRVHRNITTILITALTGGGVGGYVWRERVRERERAELIFLFKPEHQVQRLFLKAFLVLYPTPTPTHLLLTFWAPVMFPRLTFCTSDLTSFHLTWRGRTGTFQRQGLLAALQFDNVLAFSVNTWAETPTEAWKQTKLGIYKYKYEYFYIYI